MLELDIVEKFLDNPRFYFYNIHVVKLLFVLICFVIGVYSFKMFFSPNVARSENVSLVVGTLKHSYRYRQHKLVVELKEYKEKFTFNYLTESKSIDADAFFKEIVLGDDVVIGADKKILSNRRAKTVPFYQLAAQGKHYLRQEDAFAIQEHEKKCGLYLGCAMVLSCIVFMPGLVKENIHEEV